MDPLTYAKTPTGRKFGSTGTLTGQPSLLERRQAVTDMAAVSNRESSLSRRLFRQYSRASRKGDTEAGEKALDLYDRSNARGIELGGIQSHDQRMNAADADLSQRLATNQALNSEDPFDGDGWNAATPNETLATSPTQADEGIVGGPSGLPAEPFNSGPSPAEGGIMAARGRRVTPISSQRFSDPEAAWSDRSGAQNLVAGSAVSPDDNFGRKFPALSDFMKRAGEVKGYQLADPGTMQNTGLGEVSNLITSDLERDVANYRFDETLDPEERDKRMAKRAKTGRIDLTLSERSKRIRESRGTGTVPPGGSAGIRGTTF